MSFSRRRFLAGAVTGALAWQWGFARGGVHAVAAVPQTSPWGFTFLHSYEGTGRYWEGLTRSGLLRPGNGIRLVQTPIGTDDSRRFNIAARIDGPLHKILAERKCHFIVDRIVGGSPYLDYAFDQSLIAHYADLLGEKFMGGQLHETISNAHNDWQRLKKATPPVALQKPLNPELLKGGIDDRGPNTWLEYATLEQYAGRPYPTDEATFWEAVKWGAARNIDRFGGHFSYAEGSGYGELVWHHFYAMGASHCLAEVGPWASRNSQLSIASVRGAAKAAGRPWGVFYAPWGPDGCTCFVPHGDISWQIPADGHGDYDWPVGPDKGPSSALQRRIFFHSYLAGANTLHEEWGVECNLLDWEKGSLSSYGEATRAFLDFVDSNPDVGAPHVPIALVLNHAAPQIDGAQWEALATALTQPGPEDNARAIRPGAGGAEVPCYPPWAVAEIFDVVPSNAPPALWKGYQEIIPLGTAPLPEGVAPVAPEEQIARVLDAARRLSPFARTSRMPMQINFRISDGAWVIGVYNPWGAIRGEVETVGSVLDEGCTQNEVLTSQTPLGGLRVLYAWPESSAARVEDESVRITVGPGGLIVFALLPSA
jgi:hypothetical protein